MRKTFLLTLGFVVALVMMNVQTQAGYAPSCLGCISGYGYFSSYSATKPTFFFPYSPLSQCKYQLQQTPCTKGTFQNPQSCVCMPLYTINNVVYTSCSACRADAGAMKSTPKGRGPK